MNKIAHTQWNGKLFWVSSLPGTYGKDWGFTNKPEGENCYGQILDKALPLSPYWQRRFAKYCRDTNKPCCFI